MVDGSIASRLNSRRVTVPINCEIWFLCGEEVFAVTLLYIAATCVGQFFLRSWGCERPPMGFMRGRFLFYGIGVYGEF